MKILIINYEYPPIGGGGGVFTRDLAEELAKTNSVHVLTSGFSGLPKKEKLNNVVIYRVPVFNRTSLSSATMLSLLSFPASSIFKGISMLQQHKYDIINSHFAIPTGPGAVILSKMFNIPNVLTVHGGDIYDPSKKTSPHRHALLRWTVRSVINMSTTVTAQSSNTRDNALNIYRPAKNLHIIPLGIPAVPSLNISRTDLGLEEDKRYLISIGRMVKRKGYDHLIKACAPLMRNDISLQLLLIGDGPELTALQDLAKSLHISDRISFLTDVNNNKKYHYLSHSDLYVLSSLHEGFGIVLLEAMACALPIVATNNGGQTDILKDGRNAVMIDPCDITALLNAIKGLLSDPEKSEQMRSANTEDVKKFAIENVAKQYIELFKKTIDREKL